MWEAYWRRYESAGNDPSVGRKLVALLHGAGAERIENDCLFFGACAGPARFGIFVANLIGVIESARGSMAASRAVTDVEIDAALGAIRAWSGLPDAAAWYTASRDAAGWRHQVLPDRARGNELSIPGLSCSRRGRGYLPGQ